MSSGMFGKFQAVVKENVDPSQIGRIKALIPAFGNTVTDWALPCIQPNQVGALGQAIPAVGSCVWIEFEGGDQSRPIWTGCFYSRADETPAILKTPVRHQLLDRPALSKRFATGEQFTFVYFWGHSVPKDGTIGKTCFSQWYPASFEIEGITYATAEHWMMAAKARLFDEPETLEQILVASTPAEAKALGRQVKNFDDAIWKANARRLVTEGNVAKFRQNKELGEFLLATGDAVLVEASPRDCLWGIGLGQDNPKAQHPDTWRGQNLLGFALMDVRAELRKV